MKKLGVMQPYFFPYVGYFQLIQSVDTFCMYEHVTYRKRSWITRNSILDKGSGNPIRISVPIKKQSSNKLITNILIDHAQGWQEKILNQCYYNYKKAPYFDLTMSLVETVFSEHYDRIHDLNTSIVRNVAKEVGIDTTIHSNIDDTVESMVSESLRYESCNSKTKRVLHLCDHFKSYQYINPIGGLALYHKQDFTDNGKSLIFIVNEAPEYHQFHFDFSANLSILDILMHVDRVDILKMLNSYTLK